MKIALAYLFTLLTAILAYPALAKEKQPWYLGGAYSFQNISFKDIDAHKVDTLGVIAGYKIDDIFSLEYRLNTGISNDSFPLPVPSNFSNEFEYEIDYQMSILAKATYQIGRNFDVYALAGFSTTKNHMKFFGSSYDFQGNVISNSTSNYSKNTNGFTYGLGLAYQLTKQLNIFLDYQVLPDIDSMGDLKANWHSTSVGLYYLF